MEYLIKEKHIVTKLLFTTAFMLGAIAIIWMSSLFVHTNILAFAVTMVIGGVYGIGIIELLKFRHATSTLSMALSSIQEKVLVLDEWLDKLDASLRVSVRLNIDGERVGLPAPILTPYLVGLLVMLGLLGTFVGMVDTLKGAVIALESATELHAIRDGLASPIRGLSLAFGTSVAGVAASAMLGFMSTLSRRDRILAKRHLDAKVSTAFQDFSLAHNQRETFKALQIQTQALPKVADKLNIMVDKLDHLSNQLVTNQEMFHTSVKAIYSEHTASVDKIHKENLTDNIRLVGESIKPILQDTMDSFAEETQNIQNVLTLNSKENLNELCRLFVATSEEVTQSWKTGLENQTASNGRLVEHMSNSLEVFKEKFEHMAESMLTSLNKNFVSWVEQQETTEQNRLDMWTNSLEHANETAGLHFTDVSKKFADELKHVTGIHQATFETTTGEFLSMSSSLTSQLQKTGENTLSQQKEITDFLKKTATEITTNSLTATTRMHSEVTELLKSSEDLIHTRIKTEESWLDQHSERMDNLSTIIKTELCALRDDEDRRGEAAVERLGNLESTLASHLAKLGKELEDPMTQLIQTVSEVPRAAAEVLGQLRQEVSKSAGRDNRLLEEHRRIIEELDDLSHSLALTWNQQHKTIEQLVDASSRTLEDVAHRFTDHVNSEVSDFSKIAENFAVSAVEMASLGDAFSTAINIFNTSNGNLIENLNRIEESLDKSASRSDEQMGYYVAQAREIIDHCMLSQKGMFEELQQLRQENHTNTESSEWKN